MEVLSAQEARVLGALLEKEAATPEYYPLTLNALRNACNQTSSRHPVVSYDDATVEDALAGLALLCLLLLRGPQTLGELRSRSERLAPFGGTDEVEAALERLERTHFEDHPEPLVRRLPRQPGQKEARYAQLLTGEPDEADWDAPAPAAASSGQAARGAALEDLAGRVAALEDEVAALRRDLAELRELFS